MKNPMLSLFVARFVLQRIVALGCIALGANVAWGTAGLAGDKDVTIYFTNDIHTHVDNDPANGGIRYSHVAWLKRECEREGRAVFLVDAGDYLQGTAYGLLDGGERIVGIMNEAGYDVATIGNHELDFGASNLLDRVEEADFPIVSCNFWHKETAGDTGNLAFDPYVVKTNNGVSVAFVGVSTPETVTTVAPARLLDPTGSFTAWGVWGMGDPEAFYGRVQQAVDAARAENPDYIVLLGHTGMDEAGAPYRSYDVVANTTGYDAYIDGHSHTECAYSVVRDKMGEYVLVVQAGSFLSAVGEMNLSKEYDSESRLLRTPIDHGVGRDATVAALEEELIADIGGRLSEKLADLGFDMPAKDPSDGSWLVRSHATAIGDLMADAFYWYANKDGDSCGADVGFIHGGGVRDGLRAGEVLLKNAMEVAPFQNDVIVSDMYGQTLLDALEWGARTVPGKQNSALLHVAGLRYSVNVSRPSPAIEVNGAWGGVREGERRRVRDVEFYDRIDGVWRPVDPDGVYRVAGIDFILRSGGNGYVMMTNAVPVKSYDGTESDTRQFADYLKSFANGTLASANSPLCERGYAEALAYEDALFGAHRVVIGDADEIVLPAGSDQCQSEPVDLVWNVPVGAVQLIDIPVADSTNPPPAVRAGEFTYVVFGDTQDYHKESDGSCSNPSFTSRVDWVVQEKDARNIRFVSHLGDVVNNPFSEAEWRLATNQLERLAAASIPCAFAPGNHDLIWGDPSLITDRLDASRLGSLTFAGSFPGFVGRQYSSLREIQRRYSDREADYAAVIEDVAGRGANSYQLLDYGGERFIFIHLQCSIPTNVLQWVDSVLDAHPDRLAIIVEHEGLGVVNAKLPFEREVDRLNMGRMRANRSSSNGSTSPQYQWERCFSRHPNVLMVLSGHENELLSGIRTSRALYGNDVVEINQTYPEVAWSDWLRTYVVNPERKTITVHTYSPQQNVLCKGLGPEFSIHANGSGEDFGFATNCPHHFTIDYGRLRAGLSPRMAEISFRTATDDPLADGSQANGRELYRDGFAFSGLATYPIVSSVEMSRIGDELSIRYFLVNDYEIAGKGGTLRVLGVVRPRVVLTQGIVAAEVTDVLDGDVVAGGGGWYEVRAPLEAVATGLGVPAESLTNVVATVATVPEGTPSVPWTVGAGVTAFLEDGTLFIEGTGAMIDYATAAYVPWATASAHVRRVEVSPTVTHIGDHAFDGVPAGVPLALTEEQVPRAAGQILPPDVESIAVKDGKAYLAVSVYTNSDITVTTDSWGKAVLEDVTIDETGAAVLTVPAPADSGFMILKSRGTK